MANAHTRYRAYRYTVNNLCKCPRRLFTTTAYSRRCLTRPFPATRYKVTVSIQQNHSLPHSTKSLLESNKAISYYTVHSHCQYPTRPFPTTLYTVTVSVQQDHSLPHSTKSLSVSNKTIPYHTEQSYCQSPTRPFPTTQYKITVRVQIRPFPTTLYKVTVSLQQTIPCYTVHRHRQCPTNHSIPHSTKSLSVSNKTIPYYTIHSHCQCPTNHSLLHCTQ